MNDAVQIGIGAVQGLTVSAVFILAVFIGFCVLVGFTKMKRTAGGNAAVIKSLDERITHQPMQYMPATTPRGPIDQLKAPELVEAAARRS